MNTGDVVVLKSGGPRMTVEYVDGDSVHCTWFDSNKERKRDAFFESSLEDIKEVERRNQEQLRNLSSHARNNRIFL